MGLVLLVLLIACAVIFWITEFLSLMNTKDEEFAGRYDKPIWAVILLLASVLGALMFWLWKACRRDSSGKSGRSVRS